MLPWLTFVLGCFCGRSVWFMRRMRRAADSLTSSSAATAGAEASASNVVVVATGTDGSGQLAGVPDAVRGSRVGGALVSGREDTVNIWGDDGLNVLGPIEVQARP